ncbi:MAG TPA: ribonuclease III [Acetobacteraceae bacterium]|nr:ribonuclease III [Acetobacteraceae bacterium]
MSERLEELLGHRFARPELLTEAMTHRSALANRRGPRKAHSNERLEFIGDRVLGLLIAEWLAERYPAEQEGALGRRLAWLVSQPVLAEVAAAIGLEQALSVAPGEERAGVRKRATVLADALEAAIGALYLDGGLDAARAFIRRAWRAPVDEQSAPPKDPKSGLQERLHALGAEAPRYETIEQEGPPHAPSFTILVRSGALSGTGSAGSKRAAEQRAALDLLGKLPR